MNYGRAKSLLHQHHAAEVRLSEASKELEAAVKAIEEKQSLPRRYWDEAQLKEGIAKTLTAQIAMLTSQRDQARECADALRASADAFDLKSNLDWQRGAVRRAESALARYCKDVNEARRVVEEVETFERTLRDQVTKNVDLMLEAAKLPKEVLLAGLTREAYIEAQVKVKRKEAQVAAGKRNTTKPQKIFAGDSMGNKPL